MTKLLPRNVTSYDLLKTFAVIIMVIDHTGYYFFPEENWWRAIGRIGFPIWFFLAGHSIGRGMPGKLWGGALFLLAMNYITGMGMLPLNALFTIMILRLVIDRIMQPARAAQSYLWALLIICAILFFPTNNLFEYGSLALLFAMFGYVVRHKGQAYFTPNFVQNFMIAVSAVFIGYQMVIFGFDTIEFAVMAAGTGIVCITLTKFRLIEYPAIAAKLPSPLTWFTKFCGRHTLEIYIAHLTLFKIVALCLADERFDLFRMKLFIW